MTEFDDLVDHVAEYMAETTNGELPAGQRRRVVTSLHHVDLPKLSDDGLLDFDPRTGTVRYWGNERLERWLERAAVEEFS